MRRHIAPTALFGFLVAAPLPAQDWLSKVPAFPEACYSQQDKFLEELEKLSNELQESISTQAETNAALKAKLDELDGGERQSRMIAFMQKDPAAAQKFMQDMAGGQQVAQQASDLGEKREALRKKVEEADEKWKEAQKPLAPPPDAREVETSELLALERAAAARYNAGYAKLCPVWFTEPTSPFLEYLADFKRYVVDDATPAAIEFARIVALQFTVFNVPGTGFRAVDDLKAIHEYLGEVRRIFDKRPIGPRETR